VPVEIIQYYQVSPSEEQIDRAVEQHQVQVRSRVFPAIHLTMPVITQQQLNANNDDIQRRTNQEKNLFFQRIHGED